ncbi:MAG: phospholipid scramblase-related protein, partial [Flavobacterium sp.]
QVSIQRGWTFWMSNISILDPNNRIIGSIKQKFKFFKPTFIIEDASGRTIAKITGDWKAWDFKINDVNENAIGTINKKWGGVMKEVFTRADKYYVAINPDYAENSSRIAIVSCAITIDMVLKNNK